ncbi:MULTISPECIES: isochorismatase family protein [Clostridium]|uniref:isochorismatase family protein n=1 Tax=Clostridium TaxID=1485 RepID=UPI0008263B26|nr:MULTISPECIES: isochorismatase family protein [Clostridium]PJI07141.1 cysteine hydrolase [Clostridium sp. CT7]
MRELNNEKSFIEDVNKSILGIIKGLQNLKEINLEEFKKENTVIINVDLINGFCKSGNLSSQRVEKIIPYAVQINNLFKDYNKIFFVDKHTEKSAEFDAFLPHCIGGTTESEIVDELKDFASENATICEKNSVNGFLCDSYSDWLKNNLDKINMIVVGDVTDICIMNFCLTQKAFFNEKNIKSRIIVPVKAVETFDVDETNHNGDLMNIFALYNMSMNGIEIVKDIK